MIRIDQSSKELPPPQLKTGVHPTLPKIGNIQNCFQKTMQSPAEQLPPTKLLNRVCLPKNSIKEQLRLIIRDSKLTDHEKLRAIKQFVKNNMRYYRSLTTDESLISVYFFEKIDYKHSLQNISHLRAYFQEHGNEDDLAQTKLIEFAIILAQQLQTQCIKIRSKYEVLESSARSFPYITKRTFETAMGKNKKTYQLVFLLRQIIQDLITETGRDLEKSYASES